MPNHPSAASALNSPQLWSSFTYANTKYLLVAMAAPPLPSSPTGMVCSMESKLDGSQIVITLGWGGAAN